MKVIYGLHRLKRFTAPTAVAIGVFDGLHVGHRKVIRNVVTVAARRGLKSVVLTFDPHPTGVIRPKDRSASIISLNHRLALIEELGVDIVIVLSFTRALANMSADDFVRNILFAGLGARYVCVGDNFYFGKGGSGFRKLEELGKTFGFDVGVVKSVRMGGRVASSSLIRKLVTSGDLPGASKLLGRRVSVLGTVVAGARLARELGYPTANLNPHHEVIPPGGVYAVYVRYGEKFYKGVLNIGLRPTFYSPRDREPSMEVHIFDFTKRVYGHDLEVLFVKKLRNEMAFRHRDELVEQIKKDEVCARSVLKWPR